MLGRNLTLKSTRQSRKPTSFRPRFEQLEDRTVPTLTLGTLTPPDAVEGAPFTDTSLLDFTSDVGDVITDFSATISWGDGQTDIVTSVASAAGQIVEIGLGMFVVQGSHTYADDLSGATFEVRIDDITDIENATASFTPFSVAEAQLEATGVDVTALECFSTNLVTVATFIDLGGPEPLSDYSATIDWGDGATSTGADVIISLGSDGETFSVQGSHTYEGDGTFTIQVAIVHENGVTADTISTATIQKNIGILILDPTTTTLQDTGNGNVTVTGDCASIVINSSDGKAAHIVGNAVLKADEIIVAGNVQVTNNANIQGTLLTGQDPIADPFTLLDQPTQDLDAPTFTDVHFSDSEIATLDPGTYVGGIHISGQAVITLNPGVYYMDGGGFFVDGQAIVTGDGVLIFNAADESGHAIHITGDASVTLSAPTDGDFKGFAVWQDRTSSESILISGQPRVRIIGTVYAAGADVQISGLADVGLEGSETDGIASHLVVGDLRVVGNGVLTVDTSNNDEQVMPMSLGIEQGEFGFHPAGSLLTNWAGFGEKWFLDRDNHWFAITPSGDLVEWDGKSFASSLRNSHANLGRVVHSKLNLLFDATVPISPTARAQFAEVQEDFGFQFGGNYYFNWGGHKEKWFKDRLGNWFAITPSGDVFRGNMSNHVMNLSPLAFDDPTRLFDATVIVSAELKQQLSQLRTDQGFHFAGNFWQNWAGQKEKWFQDRLGNWFAITPSGDVFRGNMNNFVTNLGVLVFDDPTLLFHAKVIVSAALQQQLSQLQTAHGFHFSGSYWVNWAGRGEKWFQDRKGHWFAITPNGDIWDGQNLRKPGKSPLAHLHGIVFDDPNLLFNA
ncbi:MAG: hypothetical protein L0Y72_22935 [Gemmataceae bacterium]|nr:hypothetical protein [Gemmataceae bacterium]MCI0741899.1 hypothetical protein [Gemmataceae bacterium]